MAHQLSLCDWESLGTSLWGWFWLGCEVVKAGSRNAHHSRTPLLWEAVARLSGNGTQVLEISFGCRYSQACSKQVRNTLMGQLPISHIAFI